MNDESSSQNRPQLPEHFRERHRKWLSKLGILDRPWLIFGSSPSPTLPPELLKTHARVDVNNSGRTAQMLGLGPADLTVRKKHKPWSEHPTMQTRGLLWYHTEPLFLMRLRLLMMPRVRVGRLMRASRMERDTIVELVAGASPRETGNTGKATNGVCALCYALYVGVPEVVLSGISVSKNGHSYNERNKARMQVSEDRFILGILKDRPNIFTTEDDLAEDVGIKLWKAPESA